MSGNRDDAMQLVCKKLPATDETLAFISPFLEQKHIQQGINDWWRTPYGIYTLFSEILSGKFRCYGVFELDDAGNVQRFMGFEMGELNSFWNTVEHHAFWDRHVPVKECLKLCRQAALKDWAADGVAVTAFVCFVPDCSRAVRRLAFRYGCRDCGLVPNRFFMKDGKKYLCRMFKTDNI